MKIFMDTANVEEIREFADMGIVYGVTTNPSLIAKSGRTQAEVIPEICALIPGPVSAEVISQDCEGMVKEARELVKIADNVVVKIPCITEGLKAVKILAQTRLDRDFQNGFGVSIGRLREDKIFDWRFVCLSHNTIRGAAGGGILTAELLCRKGYITAK